MFHHLMPWMNEIGLAGLLGQLVGWAILTLPALIASVKRTQRLQVLCLVNMVALLLMDTSAWLATRGANQTWVIVCYVCAAVVWVVALVMAVISRSADKK